MNNKILRKVFWFLAFAVMALLFYSSSRTIEESRDDSARFMTLLGVVESSDEAKDSSNSPVWRLHVAIRKQAHFIAFSTLGALMYLSLYGYFGGEFKSAIAAWFASALYGAFDEFHQMFSGRGASLEDVFLDSKSALIGVLVVYILFMIIKSYPKLYTAFNKIYDFDIPSPATASS